MSAPPVAPICLVIPVWNDAARLARFGPTVAAALASAGLPVRWIIADDGSDPAERTALDELCAGFATVHPQVEVFHAPAHRGKGAVVRAAWEQAPEAAWLAFVDADGSLSAADLVALLRTATAGARSTIAVRVETPTTRVAEGPARRFLHHAYRWVACRWLGLRCADLQCGAKILRADEYRRIAPLLREESWAFDSELLFVLHRHGFGWDEAPVNWVAQPGGKVRPFSDAIRMIAALRRITRMP